MIKSKTFSLRHNLLLVILAKKEKNLTSVIITIYNMLFEKNNIS